MRILKLGYVTLFLLVYATGFAASQDRRQTLIYETVNKLKFTSRYVLEVKGYEAKINGRPIHSLLAPFVARGVASVLRHGKKIEFKPRCDAGHAVVIYRSTKDKFARRACLEDENLRPIYHEMLKMTQLATLSRRAVASKK